MIKLMDDLLSGADKGYISRLLMVDFTKAFERIDHTILIRKLIIMEVPIWLCKWTANFLSCRSQRVKYKGVYSTSKVIGTGVPQGTKFGPVGFIVLINDMMADLKYVDDSSLYEVLNHPSESTLNIRAHRLASWASMHKMKLNAEKTSEMRISFKKTVLNWEPIAFGKEEIKPVQTAKLLGFIINNKLNWADHIEQLQKKANKRIYFVRAMLRAGFSQADIVLFYCASIRSVLEYGAPVWHFSITEEQSKSIESIQKRVIKLIENIAHRDHNYNYVDLLSKHNLLSLKDRRINQCKNTFQMVHKDTQHPLHELLPKRSGKTHGMCLRSDTNPNGCDLSRRCKTERYKRSFVPSATKLFTNC